ncbi:MAG: leucyl aminopeptidase [Lewinellaceae bacterium]|nr:leucyl aminopeptidase [Saprospiraceae bacterium]MCB9338001.1 leucyl aminopeptidase [Lewinellaceae bacterium]
MKISLHHQIASLPQALIVPVAQNTDLESAFSFVAEKTQAPFELIKSDFKAASKEVQTLYMEEGQENKRLFLLGLGEKPAVKDVLAAFRSFVFNRKSNLPPDLGIDFLHTTDNGHTIPWMEAAVNGILLGLYDIGLYKTKKEAGNDQAFNDNDASLHLYVSSSQAKAAKAAIDRGVALAHTQMEIFDLVNAPANKKTPQTMAEWAALSGAKYGYDVKVLNKEEIEAQGMHALLAVNRGSENPPTFIIMEYKPKDGTVLKKVGLVGKGVTFDTGGLSIKPSTNMHYMKSDMGGAAAVMGTMEMAAKLRLPLHLTAVVPATENSVDAKSIRPGDVIGSYDGKTIEVIDTDAEGRLILADGLAYTARNFKPDVMIDLATLTGSCIRTLGTYAGGLFSNNDELAAELLAAGQLTGERLWQLPLWDDYKREIKSDVADLKNFSGNPAAGAITAAKFLEAFIQDHPAWAHLDIAGVAVGDSEFSSQKSATAFGIRLLICYLENLIAKTNSTV